VGNSPATAHEHDQTNAASSSGSSSGSSSSSSSSQPAPLTVVDAAEAASDLTDALKATAAPSSDEPSSLPGLAEWQAFLGELWERGFFEENSSGKDK
jgi:hypothetical protein